MAPFTFIAYINDWPFMKLFYWSFGTVISRLILWIFVDSVRQRMIKKAAKIAALPPQANRINSLYFLFNANPIIITNTIAAIISN